MTSEIADRLIAKYQAYIDEPSNPIPSKMAAHGIIASIRQELKELRVESAKREDLA